MHKCFFKFVPSSYFQKDLLREVQPEGQDDRINDEREKIEALVEKTVAGSPLNSE